MKFATLLVFWCCFAGVSNAQPQEGNLGVVQLPIVTPDAPISIDDQRRLGLVAIRGCSGTMINRFWALTADHCVTTDGLAGGPGLPLTALGITATWSGVTATPTRVVRGLGGLDVALLNLGLVDLGRVDLKLIHHGGWDVGLPLVKYGRGWSRLAAGTGPADAVAAFGDGLYRTATFSPTAVSATLITLGNSTAVQGGVSVPVHALFGDSGGPDFSLAPDGVTPVAIVSITRGPSGALGFVPGMPTANQWVNFVPGVESVSLETVRDQIVETTRDGVFLRCEATAAGCGAIEATALTLVLR